MAVTTYGMIPVVDAAAHSPEAAGQEIEEIETPMSELSQPEEHDYQKLKDDLLAQYKARS